MTPVPTRLAARAVTAAAIATALAVTLLFTAATAASPRTKGDAAPVGSSRTTSAAAPLARADTMFASGRVYCYMNGDRFDGGIRCDATGAKFRGVPRPDDCTLDWGITLVLDQYNPAEWGCVGDSLVNDNRLRPGRKVTVGKYECTTIKGGVRCRSTESRYGFLLTRKKFDLLHRGGPQVLAPSGIEELHPGMTLDEALATGMLEPAEAGCLGAPDYRLKPEYRAYIVWRDDRVYSINAWSNVIATTTENIGVGSTMRAVSKAYPTATKVRKSGSDEWDLYWVRTVQDGPYELHFLFRRAFELRRPWAGDPVSAIVSSRDWDPAEGLDYHGC